MINKTWFSYVVLSIGLMMFMASDKHATADEEQTLHTLDTVTEQEIKVFVNKSGDANPQVDLVVDGKEYSFVIPVLADGESKVITTEDGQEITIKSFSGNNTVLIDGNEMHLPALGNQIHVEGLSAIIARSHQLKLTDEVTISGRGLSDEMKSAIVEAVRGVLISFGEDKKVAFSSNNYGMHVLKQIGEPGDTVNYEFKIQTELSDGEKHIQIIHQDTEENIEEN